MNESQRFRLDVSMLAKIAWIFIFVVQRNLDFWDNLRQVIL